MSYEICRHKPGRQIVAPTHEDGTPYQNCLVYSGGGRIIYCDDVLEMVGALTGDPQTYLDEDNTEQGRLVARIKVALRLQVSVQAEICFKAQQDGTWDNLVPEERDVLMGRRDSQPRGWSGDLFGGRDYWVSTDVPLVLLTTGYLNNDAPGGDGLLWVDPITDEDLIETLCDLGCIGLYQLSE